MAPPVNFPRSGPDQSLFFTLFGLGAVVALVGYLTGSKTLKLVGIMLIFGATGVLVTSVFTTSAAAAAAGLSSIPPFLRPRGRAAPDRSRAHRWRVE